MGRIKIAHILESSGGGVGRHAIDVVTELANDPRFEVHLLYSPYRMDDRYRHGLEALSNQVHLQEVPMVRQIDPVLDLQGLWAIYKYLHHHGPFTATHVHSSKAGAIAAAAARLAGVPEVVFTPHAFYSMGLSGAKRLLYQEIERCCVALCNHLVAVSPQEAAYILRHRLAPRRKIEIIPNGISPPNLQRGQASRQLLRQQLGIAAHTRLIGSIGRLTPQKDPLSFVAMVAQRAARYSSDEECYLMAGDGDLEPAILAAIKQAGIGDRLLFLGFRADVDSLLAALDIYVLHSLYEGMPYIILEAMGHGLPIVSTHVAGVAEPLSDGGILVPIGDVAALDWGLDELLDPERRRQMGAANRSRLEKYYSVHTMVTDLSNLYLPPARISVPVTA